MNVMFTFREASEKLALSRCDLVFTHLVQFDPSVAEKVLAFEFGYMQRDVRRCACRNEETKITKTRSVERSRFTWFTWFLFGVLCKVYGLSSVN